MIDLRDKLGEARQQIAAHLKLQAKLRTLIRAAEKDLGVGKRPLQALRKLAAGVRVISAQDKPLSASELADFIDQQAGALAVGHQHSLELELQAAAAAAGFNLGRSGADWTVGPFLLKLQPAKEAASLEYAKLEVASGVPLEVSAIIARAKRLAEGLLAPPRPDELPLLASQFEEALRVSLARQKHGSLSGELRAELPAVYEEMKWIRSAAQKGRQMLDIYPVARLVVELKTLVGSNFNLERPRRFRLETAVLENSKNVKKSYFIPSQLQQGWGEGTYYQAIVLLASS